MARQEFSHRLSCLWAEMTWVYLLIHRPGSMRAAKKRARIGEIWNWSGRDLPGDHDLLNDAVLGAGVAHPGPAYSVHAWKEFRFFATAMLRWFSLEIDERASLLDRPWRFAKWLDDTKYAQNRMFRHIVLFLLFPDEFEPISTSGHKMQIVDRLHQGERVDASNLVALDRAILAIRKRLEDLYPGEELHPYGSPFKDLWQGPVTPKPQKRGETVHAEITKRHQLNQILYGPPGTGKTYRATACAMAIVKGIEADEVTEEHRTEFRNLRFDPTNETGQIAMVTFHQNFSYEDFVEGIRPRLAEGGDIGYELRPGIFRRIVDVALADPDRPYVLIIDEINRGNIPKDPRRAHHADRTVPAHRPRRRDDCHVALFRRQLRSSGQPAHHRYHEHCRPLHSSSRHRATAQVRPCGDVARPGSSAHRG